jgi:hypothetical protein
MPLDPASAMRAPRSGARPAADPPTPEGPHQTSYLVFGHRGAFGATLDLAGLVAGTGVKIHGAAAGDHSGVAVSGAGDLNGDGLDDLIVGAYTAAPHGPARSTTPSRGASSTGAG